MRAGEPPSALAEELSRGPDSTWRKRAALAFAERGDARGASDLVLLFSEDRGEFEAAKIVLSALAKIRAKEAVPALLAALGDVRLRPFVADALGAIGSPGATSARAPLVALFGEERFPAARAAEARAIIALGGIDDAYTSLRRFAGVPEPMIDAIAIADGARLLDEKHGALSHAGVDAGDALEGDVTILTREKPANSSFSKKSREHLCRTTRASRIRRRRERRFDGARKRRVDGPDFVREEQKRTIHVRAANARIAPASFRSRRTSALPPPEAWDAGAGERWASGWGTVEAF